MNFRFLTYLQGTMFWQVAPQLNSRLLEKSTIQILLHSKKQKILCAKYRKGHFEGVIDVMDRLTKIIMPKKIFMGEKDFQQLYLVKRYIKKKYNIKVISCKTIRDHNGLALSSRNFNIEKKGLIKASKLTRNLIQFKKDLKSPSHSKSLIICSISDLILFTSFNPIS